jgi:hypothetical protein
VAADDFMRLRIAQADAELAREYHNALLAAAGDGL